MAVLKDFYRSFLRCMEVGESITHTLITLTILCLTVWSLPSDSDKARLLNAIQEFGRALVSDVRNDVVIKSIRPKSSRNRLSSKEVDELLLASSWPVHLHKKVKRVIFCESGFDPRAERDNGKWGIDVGPMQINTHFHRFTMDSLDLSLEDLKDAWLNINFGYRVYVLAGETWKPWLASNHCHRLLPT